MGVRYPTSRTFRWRTITNLGGAPLDRTDSDNAVAEAAVRALQTHVWAPSRIQATVENGWVSLDDALAILGRAPLRCKRRT